MKNLNIKNKLLNIWVVHHCLLFLVFCYHAKLIKSKKSPVTVISHRVYDAMDREFEEEGTIVSSAIRKSKLKLCKYDQEVATS